VNNEASDSDSSSLSELRLRHLTIDEALPRLERYLHDAYMAGLPRVRIIHGKGAGILRLSVRRELARHSLVKSFRPGDNREGGQGVTIVEFTEG
jgi:DNA mismatch repair protein MutS2